MIDGMTKRRMRFILNGRACWTETYISDELAGNELLERILARDNERCLSRLAESRWGNGKLVHLRGNRYKWIPLEKLTT